MDLSGCGHAEGARPQLGLPHQTSPRARTATTSGWPSSTTPSRVRPRPRLRARRAASTRRPGARGCSTGSSPAPPTRSASLDDDARPFILTTLHVVYGRTPADRGADCRRSPNGCPLGRAGGGCARTSSRSATSTSTAQRPALRGVHLDRAAPARALKAMPRTIFDTPKPPPASTTRSPGSPRAAKAASRRSLRPRLAPSTSCCHG